MRDDRPFAGPAPPAAVYYASSDRRGEHPAEASGRLRRHPASRLLQRLRAAVRPAEEGTADYAGVLLCPCAAGLLRAGRHREKRPGRPRRANRSPRSRWRRSGASTRCSRSSAPSMAAAPTSGAPCARRRANHFSTTCTPGCSVSAKPSRAPAEVLKPINYMLRRWADFARFLDDGRICLTNNCGRTRVARHRLGKAQLDLRRQPARRRPCRRHADDDHDLSPQRRRSQGLARRRPRPYRRSSRLASARTAALGMEAPAPSRQARRSAGRLLWRTVATVHPIKRCRHLQNPS